jgi:hypothetical protein
MLEIVYICSNRGAVQPTEVYNDGSDFGEDRPCSKLRKELCP